MKNVALALLIVFPLWAIASPLPCQNPYCMFLYLGYQDVINRYSEIEVTELFRSQMQKDEASCFVRRDLLRQDDAVAYIQRKSEHQLISFRHDLMMSLFEVERAFYNNDASLSADAVEKLCRQLERLRTVFGKYIPCWPVCCVEMSFARLILASKICDEAILTLVLSKERLDLLSNISEMEYWRVRRFRDLLVCAIRVMSFQRAQGCLPNSKSDFMKNDESFASDIEYDRRGSVWQIKVGYDGDAEADFDVYVPDVLNPAGVVKTMELRLSSSFNEKRRHVFLYGNLYEDDPRWACYIKHSRSHSLSWQNLGIGGLWKIHDVDTGKMTLKCTKPLSLGSTLFAFATTDQGKMFGPFPYWETRVGSYQWKTFTMHYLVSDKTNVRDTCKSWIAALYRDSESPNRYMLKFTVRKRESEYDAWQEEDGGVMVFVLKDGKVHSFRQDVEASKRNTIDIDVCEASKSNRYFKIRISSQGWHDEVCSFPVAD